MTLIVLSVVFALIAAIMITVGILVGKSAPSENTDYSQDGLTKKNMATIFKIVGFVILFIEAVILICNSYEVTNSGTVKVGKVFGKIQKNVIYEGLSFPVNPIANWTEVNVQRNSVAAEDGTGEPGMTSTTADNNFATVTANFNYMVNPEYAWWVLKYLGSKNKFESDLLMKSAQSATRDALAHYKLEDAQIKKRVEFENMLTEQFSENIFIGLPQKELTAEELKKVFKIYPTQLMSVKPDTKVANALSEKKATEILLEQQKTLTDIENERAKRKKAEGVGIKNMFDELPKGYTAGDVAIILNASANKTRAEAMMKAVTDNKINFGIFEGEAARTAK